MNNGLLVGGQFYGWQYDSNVTNASLYDITSGLDVNNLNAFLSLYGDLRDESDSTRALSYAILGEYSPEIDFLDRLSISANTDLILV